MKSTGYQDPVEAWEQRLQSSLQWMVTQRLRFRADILQDRYGSNWMPLQPVFRGFYSAAGKAPVSWKAGAGVARHYARPSLNDRFWYPGGNPDLNPESGWMTDADASLHYRRNGFRAELSALGWYGRVDNWIQWAPTGGTIWEAANLNQVQTRGVEFRTALDHLGNTLGWHFEGMYSYTKARAEDGNYLLYQPEHRAVSRIQLTWKSFSAGLRQQCSSWRPAASDAQSWLPAYALFATDLSAEKTLGSWSFMARLSLENLMNTYTETVLNRPQPGRSLRIELALRHQKQTNH